MSKSEMLSYISQQQCGFHDDLSV